MTLAKPAWHGSVYEVTLHDFRNVYRSDGDRNSECCVHRVTPRAAALFGFEFVGSGRSGYTRDVRFPAQSELHRTNVIQFDQIRPTKVSVEVESLTTDRYMNEDWMVFSFATVILGEDLTAYLDIRSSSEFDLRKFRFVSKPNLTPYVDSVKTHYASLAADLDVAYPSSLESYIPPDEPA